MGWRRWEAHLDPECKTQSQSGLRVGVTSSNLVLYLTVCQNH